MNFLPIHNDDPLTLILSIIIAYLLGSIPFGLIWAKIFKLGNFLYTNTLTITVIIEVVISDMNKYTLKSSISFNTNFAINSSVINFWNFNYHIL